MKSISFFRNTWKKWDKSSDSRDTTKLEISNPQEFQRPRHIRPLAENGHSLTVSAKRLPANMSSTSLVDDSWHPYESPRSSSHPPSRDQVHVQQPHRTLVHRDSGRFDLQPHSSFPTEYVQGSSRRPSLPTSPSSPSINMSNNLSLPSLRSRKEDHDSPRVSSIHPKHPPSPLVRPPSLPVTQLLPPMDMDFASERRQNFNSESKAVVRPNSQSTRDAMVNSSKKIPSRRVSPNPSGSPRTVHAILDLSHDTKPRTLYHNTGSSTPYLPYRERAQSNYTAGSDNSSHSVTSSEAEHFPLSLFPLPPPLIVRKKVPAPLILRSTPSASAQSSRDSTPVGTPTSPRFQYTTSPSQSSIVSPTKKFSLGRSSASISPPPFSPPNSPLPNPPIEGGARKPTRDVQRPTLRTTQSNNNFRNALPFPPTHRLNSSEPISDQSRLPIRRPAKPRPTTERPKNIQTYMADVDQLDSKGRPLQVSDNENHVQWGYAF